MSTELVERPMKYEVSGEEITLTINMVRGYLIKGDSKSVTDQEIIRFMNLCKYQKLNPFVNEAYLVKFGADAQLIVGKEAFMKRADAHKNYEGFEAGIIILTSNGDIVHREGTFYLNGEELVGGWCKVYRNDRSKPIVAEVSNREYSTGKSTWGTKPATMIRKVALVQALREAFPNELGALYVSEEIQDKLDVTPSIQEEVKQEIIEGSSQQVLSFNQSIPNQAPILNREKTPISDVLYQEDINTQFASSNSAPIDLGSKRAVSDGIKVQEVEHFTFDDMAEVDMEF